MEKTNVCWDPIHGEKLYLNGFGPEETCNLTTLGLLAKKYVIDAISVESGHVPVFVGNAEDIEYLYVRCGVKWSPGQLNLPSLKSIILGNPYTGGALEEIPKDVLRAGYTLIFESAYYYGGLGETKCVAEMGLYYDRERDEMLYNRN